MKNKKDEQSKILGILFSLGIFLAGLTLVVIVNNLFTREHYINIELKCYTEKNICVISKSCSGCFYD